MSNPEAPIDALRKRLTRALTSAHQQIDTDVANLGDAEPHEIARLLSWSKGLLHAAARYEVISRITVVLDSIEPDMDDGPTFESIEEYTAEEVNRQGRNPAESASPMHNLIDTYRLAAWAEVQEMIRSIRKYGDTL